MRKFFGTDGIRGRVNSNVMNAEMALRLGRATVEVFYKRTKTHEPKIVIGNDIRSAARGIAMDRLVVGGCHDHEQQRDGQRDRQREMQSCRSGHDQDQEDLLGGISHRR